MILPRRKLAKILMIEKHYLQASMIYEDIKDFEKAEECFIKLMQEDEK